MSDSGRTLSDWRDDPWEHVRRLKADLAETRRQLDDLRAIHRATAGEHEARLEREVEQLKGCNDELQSLHNLQDMEIKRLEREAERLREAARAYLAAFDRAAASQRHLNADAEFDTCTPRDWQRHGALCADRAARLADLRSIVEAKP